MQMLVFSTIAKIVTRQQGLSITFLVPEQGYLIWLALQYQVPRVLQPARVRRETDEVALW